MKQKTLITTLAFFVALFPLLAPLSASAADASPWWQYDSGTKRSAVSSLPEIRVEAVPIPILFGIEPSDLTPNFGAARSGGRSHEGLDIMAPRRALIISPTKAVVHSLGNGASSGLYVYTYNPGGEVFAYMHLDEIAPGLAKGDILEPGDLIGYVGNTGNASGGATHLHFEIRDSVALDPYLRLTTQFSTNEKLRFLDGILAESTDTVKDAISTLVAAYYTPEMRAAQASGLLLPSSVEAKLGTVSSADIPSASAVTQSTSSSNPSEGMEGSEVTTLQSFLIESNVGPAARALGAVGATGYFGSLTTAALAEYQVAVHLPTTTGVYDTKTKEYVDFIMGGVVSNQSSDDIVEPSQPTADTTSPPAPVTTSKPVSTSDMPEINLTNGASGSSVVWLQTFLIGKQSGPKATALRDATATGYFGPVTTAALAEYQSLVGIAPAVGYYGPVTRDYIRTHY